MDKTPFNGGYDTDWLEAFVTTQRASQLTGISVATLVTWRSRGGGPPFSKVGALVRYRRRSLLDFMQQREQRNTADRPVDARATKPFLDKPSTRVAQHND